MPYHDCTLIEGVRKKKKKLLSWASSSKPLLLFLEILPADEGWARNSLLRKDALLEMVIVCKGGYISHF